MKKIIYLILMLVLSISPAYAYDTQKIMIIGKVKMRKYPQIF